MSDTTNPITHVFDQTNGVTEGLEGESDGTATGDVQSTADRNQDLDGVVPGDDRPRASDGVRDASTDSQRDDGSDAGRATDPSDTAADGGTVVQRTGTTQPAGDDASPGTARDSDDSGFADLRTDHTYAVDSAGAAEETDDAGSTGGTAQSYDVGPASQVSREDGAHDAGERTVAVAADDASPRSTTAESYDDGPTAEATGGADDLVDDRTDIDATPSRSAMGTNGLAALVADDDSIGHVFDQTNGVVAGLDGDSDGTAGSDEDSAADRGGLNEPNPVGREDAFHDDKYGTEDGRDQNP